MGSKKKKKAAIEGWYTLEDDLPSLIGNRCKACGTYFFPKEKLFCRNPDCDSDIFEEVKLSRKGKVWSYTNACYQPPEPYVSTEPFEPFTIVAVELEEEKMIVLGQAMKEVTCDDLKVGQDMELVLDILSEDENCEDVIWKWQPLTS